MNGLLLRIELYGPQPGSGPSWTLQIRDEAGAIICHSSGSRDVVLAAFAEFVEELHMVRS